MRYSGGDPNLGNTGGMEILAVGIPYEKFGNINPQKQINQYDKLDTVRLLGNMNDAQRNGFANKRVF